MNKIAIYAGSFDPPSHGHINIISRGLSLFDKVIVTVAKNTNKKALFPTPERVHLLKTLLKDEKNVEVDTFENELLVNYARKKGAKYLLRGLRTLQDYEYEFQMSLANRQLAPEIETIFIMTEARYSHISSTLIKEILSLGGPGDGLVDPLVENRVREKLNQH